MTFVTKSNILNPEKQKKKQKIELQMFQRAAGRILESDWFLLNYEFKFTIFSLSF